MLLEVLVNKHDSIIVSISCEYMAFIKVILKYSCIFNIVLNIALWKRI